MESSAWGTKNQKLANSKTGWLSQTPEENKDMQPQWRLYHSVHMEAQGTEYSICFVYF